MDRIPESTRQEQLLDVFVTLVETYDLWPTSWCRAHAHDLTISCSRP